MNYSYKYKLNQKDMWKYYMIDRYSSMAGLVQIIFIVSLIILIYRKWFDLGTVIRVLVIIGLSLFTIIQPLAFWINAKKSIDPNMPETELIFNETQMVIKVNEHIQTIEYPKFIKVISKPGQLILQPDEKHIYILPSRILGSSKKELFKYLKTKII